jgi:formylglycine-generating enzyme
VNIAFFDAGKGVSNVVIVSRLISEWAEAGCPQPLIRNDRDGSVMVLIPGGAFEMGDGLDPDCPRHAVWLDAYGMGVFAVTNRQYRRFVMETKYRPPGGARWRNTELADHPVTDVDWDDAAAYATWAGCALPTEAQWERAARGPHDLVYPWGHEWDDRRCRHNGNKGAEQTCAVWGYASGVSGFGTYNQSGNVWEWCRDWYDAAAYAGPQSARNPEGPPEGALRICRGGSWGGDDPTSFRAAARDKGTPGLHLDILGFRIVARI